jgi:hypothetical protein
VASLLPARPISAAAEQAALCGESSTQSATMATFASPAADQPVQISKEEVTRAAFLANWKNRYTDAEDVYESAINYVALVAPIDANLNWEKILPEIDEKYNKAIPPVKMNDQNLYSYDDILHTTLDVMLTVPEIAPFVPRVWSELANLNETDVFIATFGDSASKVSASTWRYSQAARMIASSSDIVARIHDCAQKNPALAAAFDQLHAEKLNASITDDAMTILEKNLDLSFPEVLRGRIAEDGTITISLDALKATSQGELDRIHTTIDGMQETLVEIDQQQSQ